MPDSTLDHYAILVGVSTYADASTFPRLDSPLNDVALFSQWLTAPDGGNVPADHITTLISPPTMPEGLDLDSVPPLAEDFKKAFKKLVRNQDGRMVARQGRLYLYFSGHGFCERKSLTPQATLYAANATRDFPENIFGTFYAHTVRDKALFSEIVLIMDCCRDAEVNRPPDVPAINEASGAEAEQTKLFCLYAAPKGGKAVERAIPERANHVHGLLTHAFLKALDEARPDAGRFITSASLKRHLLETWPAICGDSPAPFPEVVTPTGFDLQFQSRNRGIRKAFRLGSALEAAATMHVFDNTQQLVAVCHLRPVPEPSTVAWHDGAPEAMPFDGLSFSLSMHPGFYQYTIDLGGTTSKDFFAVETGGGHHVPL
ncbi:caspase family protein [Cupriavidus sp. NPDC089707]|uniref:caspase family protein n=1 Tax=Cupriavidus sp. NPDC089707 TaxID=3363963 RepID=UPI00380788C5